MNGTIKSSMEIDRLFSCGRKIKLKGMIVIYSQEKGRDLPGRVAFIAGKKIGNAPKRNRAKRLMRHAVYEACGNDVDRDVAFVARGRILSMEYAEIVEECRDALTRIKSKR